MKLIGSFLICLFAVCASFGQSSPWKGYFSYRNVQGLSTSQNGIFAATENAYFKRDLTTGELKTMNTIDGLSGYTISSIHHSVSLNKTFLGYENGLVIMVDERDQQIRQFVDIVNKSGLAPNVKRVNDFSEDDNYIYISADFGVVLFNKQTMLFGDTWYLGNNANPVAVAQTLVKDEYVYAVTKNQGIKYAFRNNPNLVNFSQWATYNSVNWNRIVFNGNQMLGLHAGDHQLYQITNQGNLLTANFSGIGKGLEVSEDYVIATTAQAVYILNNNLSLQQTIQRTQLPQATYEFTSGRIVNQTIYIGSAGDGLWQIPLGTTQAEQLLPDGPERNSIFALQHAPSGNFFWAVYGDYTQTYNPYPLDRYGVGKYEHGVGWKNISFTQAGGVRTLVRPAIEPNQENVTFFASYIDGLLKFENDQFSAIYNHETPGGPESLSASSNDMRINSPVFDKNGNVWITNSMVQRGLKVLKKDGSWTSYNFNNYMSNPTNTSYGRMVIDKNNTKWFVSNLEGAIGYNERLNPPLRKVNSNAAGNYMFSNATALAIDTRNQLWIGYIGGLRVVSSVDRFLNESNVDARSIIILEDDLARELMADQFITDICVDGANNKWIGTADSGVFLLSPNGQETLLHLTTANSPLPSNSINDIEINGATGEVFIATNRGMVSYKGSATDANDNLNQVEVFPNPVRPEYAGTVKIQGLMDKSNVKITDIEGNLVYEVIATGGTIEWDTTAFGKYKVASGVYMIFVTSEDGGETKVKKLMIVR